MEGSVRLGMSMSSVRQNEESLLTNLMKLRGRMSKAWNLSIQFVSCSFVIPETIAELYVQHFLTPIIASLDTSSPLLERAELTSVFSNFIDIWNLHRSFYSSLTTYLQSPTSSNSNNHGPLPLSPILLSHFPYLSLYSPFITAFPDLITSLTSLLSSNPAFATFIAKQEADPRCGKLKLHDWLLTIVQRCPRYLLLLKDLIQCTDPDDPEYDALTKVHTLVSKSKPSPLIWQPG